MVKAKQYMRENKVHTVNNQRFLPRRCTAIKKIISLRHVECACFISLSLACLL